MGELFERLERTGALLSSAIDQYVDACIAVSTSPRLSFAGVSRAFFDRVVSELPLVTTYETKIKQAKATISHTINTSPPVSHINSLPPEILIRIFYIVTNTCGLMQDVGCSIPLPRYPEFLSHVCTRWRQVALDSPHLWTHIDLVRLSKANHGFKPRAETFLSRAGSSLLDVHLYEQNDCHGYDNQSMLDIIALAAPRTRSLELVARFIPGYGQHPRLLDHCLNNYVPRMFTKLGITERRDLSIISTQSTHFIDSYDRSSQVTWLEPLNIPAEHLDALLLPVTHLKLDGVYFPWTHQAYHGLVELRLLVNNECGALITKLELESILTTSPRLKLLHFEIKIVNNPPMGSFVAPVCLDDLEELQLHSLEDETPHLVLSLLAAGQKPLRFSFIHKELNDTGHSQQEWSAQIKEFFKRSNITELRLRYATWPPDMGPENVLVPLPNLRVLVLEACSDDPRYPPNPFTALDSNPPRLDVIYMVECVIELGKLARTLRHFQAKLVVFWGCEFIKDEDTIQYRKDIEAIKAELDVICRSFTWIDKHEPNPIADWD